MAITSLTTPSQLEPVWQNTIPFRFSSTISSTTNFRYVFDVFTTDQVSGSNTFKTRVNPFPRPDGTGLYSPHYVLRDNVNYNFQPMISVPTAASVSLVKYYINAGEEYDPGKTWSATYNSTGNLGLTFATSHGMLAGDIILLNKTDKSVNVGYDGTCSVLSVTTLTSLRTSKTYGSVVGAEDGTITDVLRMSFTSSSLWAFNGCRQYDEVALTFSQYTLVDSKSKFLTKFNGVKGLFVSDYQTISYIAATAGPKPTHAIYKFYNAGIITATVSLTFSVANYLRVDVPTSFASTLGAGNGALNTAHSNAALIGPNAQFSIQMGTWSSFPTGSPTYLSQAFTYSYNKTGDKAFCSYSNREYPIIQVSFLNKLGAFEYMTFNLVNKTTVKVARKNYKKVLAYDYVVGNRSTTSFDMNVTEELSLQSDYLSDEEALQVRDLVTSPEVYIISQFDPITNIGNTVSYPIIVTNDSYTVQNTLNDVMFSFRLTAEKAYTIYTNI